ncbi:MAG TPA: extracellular solute-binding protein [Chloroflexota bacterium]|nr:extracellular solute-binding protein [Chloroflexota bacterium]
MRIPFQRSFYAIGILSLCLLAAGCGSSSSNGSGGSGSSGGSSGSATNGKGQKVTFLGGWGAGEQTDFKAILSYCDSHYNLKAVYELAPGGAVDTTLSTDVQGGHAPDLAALSAPSEITPYVSGNSLTPLTWLPMSRIHSQYSSFWTNLGTFNGKLYAVYMKADVKSLVWYDPKKFSAGGYTIPKTWSQLMALSQRMVSQGKHPWAFGVGGSPASPWTLTDFLENLVLNDYGPSTYKAWYLGKLSWTSPQITHAMSQLEQIIGNNAMIAGGRSRSLSQAWDQGAAQMVTDPNAEFFQEATFTEAGLQTDLPKAKAGVDYNAFAFPSVKSFPVPPAEVGPNGVVAFNSKPATKALITCLTDPKALEQWAKLGGYVSPNNAVPISVYHDPVLRMAARMLNNAGAHNLVVGDASDLMPPALGSDYEFTELQRWFENPTSTATIQSQLEAKAKTLYK